ncbi:MAG: tetratricopeptide repeat protein [Deltaproteobacteria bacterium]|nr:tetratricopeptide repeat protein [Deltaproteobacteria bacterium]
MRSTHPTRAIAAALTAAISLTSTAPLYAQPGGTPIGAAPTDPAPAPTPATPGETGTPNVVPPPAPMPAIQPPAPLSADEKKVLRDVELQYERFQQVADQHAARMRTILHQEYDQRTQALEKKYADRIAKVEKDKADRQAETITLLEKFLVDHPAHQEFTPDAMFRLASLYLDTAEQQVDLDDNPEAMADYSRSLDLWQKILDQFPKYRQLPSTLFLLAYYGRTKDERKSLQLFLSLVCANKYKWTDAPPPVPTREQAIAASDRKQLSDKYADCKAMDGADPDLQQHAWVRGIADYHFTVPGELDEGIAAYRKVVDVDKESPLYAEALYKLAWSFYKRDFLLDAIKRFDESVVLYDQIVARGDTPPLELRDEALQYISVAFTDPWDGETDTDPVKSFDRAKEFYKDRMTQPHVRDVWVAMGHAFMELQAYDQAVDSFKIAIGSPWELNPNNPVVHQEIVDAYHAKGDKYAEDNAAAELAIKYAPGSPWYVANEKDRQAMDNQRRIAERALYAAARNTHTSATELRKEYEAGGKKEAAIREEYLGLYSKAVELYQTYIQQYPESDYVYELTFFMGEALYFSEHYMEAVDQYTWVRDHRDLSQQYFLDAASGVVASYQAEADKQVAAGTIQPLKVPTSEELKALPQPLQAQPIPDVYLKLQAEWDNYQNIVPDPKTAPQQGINAALVSLAYLHIEDAVARFNKVMKNFCGTPEYAKAKDGLLAIYEATSQLDKFQETNTDFIKSGCGDAKAIDLAKSQNRSIDFKKAGELYASKQYVQAGDAFYNYYKTAPAGDADLPTALYNSAVAYKLGERPKTAISLFKEFTSNKDKAFRESSYYLEAMRLTAVSYQATYDYNTAIATYLDLHDLAKTAKKKGLKPPEPIPGEPARTFDQVALDALFNAAVLAELNRDFKKSLELYGRYSAEETNKRNKDRALWAVARIYKASGDVTSLTETYDKWRRLYGNDAGNEDDYVMSFYETSKLWQRKGRTPQADAAGRDTIDAWRKKGATKNSVGAKVAGEWALVFAERSYFAKFEPFAWKTAAKTDKELKARKAELDKLARTTQDTYVALDDFGVAEYSMAAKVRYGEVLFKYTEKFTQQPTPKFIVDLNNRNPDADAIAKYEDALSRNLQPNIDQAKAQWSEVVDLAKKNGVSNKWSQIALEDLGTEFPDQFPVLHQELFQGTEAP